MTDKGAAMKRLILACLLLYSTSTPLRAEEDYQLIHNLAHLGAGELIAAPTAIFLNTSGFRAKHPVWAGFFVVGLPLLAGYLKEKNDQDRGGDFNYGEWTSTALSGVLVETVVLTWH